MKSLLIATMLALTPVPALAQTAQPQTQYTVSDKEIDARAAVCIGVLTGKIAPQEVITGLRLNTPEAQRNFVVQCKLFFRGVDVGAEMEQKRISKQLKDTA